MRFKLISFLIFVVYYLSQIDAEVKDAGEPLFLTPYISSGQIIEARRLALVSKLSTSIESYSGLITVDQTTGAHTFFWFFPAQNDAGNAPVILWNEGGPGFTGLFSVFVEHGPFYVGEDGDLKRRDTSWAVNHSVIYMDQPIDVGFSFTEQEMGYVSSGIDCAPNIYNFLVQFFIMFPEFQSKDFYSCGVSFGGIYAPAVAHYIDSKNKEPLADLQINLKGLFLESPFTDPISQVEYGAYLFHVGLIDEESLLHFTTEEERIRNLILQGQYAQASSVNNDLILGEPNTEDRTYYQNVTGLDQYFNILTEQPDDSDMNWLPFVETEDFRRAVHVGRLPFNYISPLVLDLFNPNMLRSVKHLVNDLLNSGYKILILSGQFDVITNHFGVDKMIKTFIWGGAEEFRSATRNILTIDNTVTGYLKSGGNLTQVVLRNAGHDSMIDQPIWTLDILNNFIKNNPFSSQ